MKAKRRAVFLDRDGVLMRDLDYVCDPRQVRALKGAGAALRLLRKAGLKLVVVSNQSGIGRGYFTRRDAERVNAELRRQLAREGGRWDALYMAPQLPGSRHPWRKPGPGMLKAAARRFGLDLRASYMVGDKTSDVECGRRAGCATVLVRTGKGGRDRVYKAEPTAVKRDLTSAARWILHRA